MGSGTLLLDLSMALADHSLCDDHRAELNAVGPNRLWRVDPRVLGRSYYLLKQPIRWNPWLSSQAVRSVALGAALTLAGALLAVGAGAFANELASSPSQRMIDNVTGERPTASNRGCLISFTDSGTRALHVRSGHTRSNHSSLWRLPRGSMVNPHHLPC